MRVNLVKNILSFHLKMFSGVALFDRLQAIKKNTKNKA